MQFTYTYLKNAADRNVLIGNWRGYPVYALSKRDLDNTRTDCIYLLYDDKNYLYRANYIYGTVDKFGDVNEFSPELYRLEEEKKEKTPDMSEAHIIGDVELGLIVDKTLNDVQTMTVNDLLKGFDYGLA